MDTRTSNWAARTLVTGRSRVVGVVTTSHLLFGPTTLVDGVEGAARELGYFVSVVSCRERSARELRGAIARLVRQGVDGIIVLAPSHADELALLATQLPLVVIGGTHHACVTVNVDQSYGARLATQYLLGLGHPTVWHVAGPAGWFETAWRVAGWRAALTDAGAEVPPTYSSDWTARGGYEVGLRLARTPGVSAVLAANDQTALGLIRAFTEARRRVPEDVSIVGFDDLPESGYFSPPLTTVRQDFAELGRLGLAQLSDLIDGGPRPAATSVAPTLVIRSTTARPGTPPVG